MDQPKTNRPSQCPHAKLRLTAILFAVVTLGLPACRSGGVRVNGQNVKGNLAKLDSQATNPPEPAIQIPPKATVVDVPGGLLVARTHVQSRTPISITISPDAVALGDTFSLVDDSTGQTLVSRQAIALFDGVDSGRGVASAFRLEAATSLKPYDLTLKLYPLDPELKGKLAYGENHLRLLVSEGSPSPKRSESLLQRGDFTLTGLSRSYFQGPGQRRDGFEAEIGLWHQPLGATGQRTLTMGVIPLLSR